MDPLGRSGHESMTVALGTAAGYGLVLLGMFLVLFVLPYLVYLAL